MRRDVGVAGGGAAGPTAAITAARLGARVTILERNDRPGKKILATGNGKCNLGNQKLAVSEYYTSGDPGFVAECLERFGTKQTIRFFEELGLGVKDKNGYLYPACEQASAVLDVLRYEAAALGVRLITECRVRRIEADRGSGKILVWGDDDRYSFDSLVLACGGRAAPKTGSDGNGFFLAGQLGHSMVPVVPALVQLRCREDFFKSVAGVRAEAVVRLLTQLGEFSERGELQLTDYGISGIPVFQLSRTVNYILQGQKEVEVSIDFLPWYTKEEFGSLCTARRQRLGNRTAEEFFTGLVHKKLILLLLRLAGLKAGESVDEADPEKIERFYRLCRDFRVHVTGSNSFDSAQVCAGGIPLCEITESMESRKAPGIYLAGEILDVDGKCGGYNLQWAWCSGFLAGQGAAGGGS